MLLVEGAVLVLSMLSVTAGSGLESMFARSSWHMMCSSASETWAPDAF